VLATSTHKDDIAQIVYGLSLRGIDARPERDPDRRGGYRAVLESGDADIARRAMHPIWDAVLAEIPRCVDRGGACIFCGYSVIGLPTPTVCPECGRSLDTIAARRAVREGATPRPEDTHEDG